MPENHLYESAYIAFDPYPSFKGSATHITEVYQTMCKQFSNCLLLTLEGTETPEKHHWQPDSLTGNYLQRGLAFSKQVKNLISQESALRVVQYRDIWGGMAVSERPALKGIFEANGFPSIELKERYQILPKSTISKLIQLENICLNTAHEILCPSRVIADHIVGRGIDSRKIHIIANGSHLPDKFDECTAELPEKYLVYFGALQPWQGLNTAFKAMTYLKDKKDIHLVICSSHKEKLSRPLKKQIAKLGIEGQVIWRYQLTKPQLHSIINKAQISLAPLAECERNLIQGCSPLKIYESMACQTAIIASDIPVTREILTHEENAILIRADRPAELARNIRMLLENPDKRKKIVASAFEKVSSAHSWDSSNEKLADLYQQLLKPEHY